MFLIIIAKISLASHLMKVRSKLMSDCIENVQAGERVYFGAPMQKKIVQKINYEIGLPYILIKDIILSQNLTNHSFRYFGALDPSCMQIFNFMSFGKKKKKKKKKKIKK